MDADPSTRRPAFGLTRVRALVGEAAHGHGHGVGEPVVEGQSRYTDYPVEGDELADLDRANRVLLCVWMRQTAGRANRCAEAQKHATTDGLQEDRTAWR